MADRQRKAHSKSRNGCVECKRLHRRCDELYPQCSNCLKRSTKCSLSTPSPTSAAVDEGQALGLNNLRLLHHWHMASNSSDFLKFVDHDHKDDDAEYDRMISLSFSHPYLLHTILALSALHMLHSDADNMDLYQQASAHMSSALKLARPQMQSHNLEHSDALYCFSGFASLYAVAEPPLRLSSSKLTAPVDCLQALLDAFEMSRGIHAVMKSYHQQIEESGFLNRERWKDDRDDVLPSLEDDYPQLSVLQKLIDQKCDANQRGHCHNAIHLLFVYMAVLERQPINHSTISLIQRWPMDIDHAVLEMAAEQAPVALVMLAHYAALMHMRRNYWFFARWPSLLFSAIEQLVPSTMLQYLDWPKARIRS